MFLKWISKFSKLWCDMSQEERVGTDGTSRRSIAHNAAISKIKNYENHHILVLAVYFYCSTRQSIDYSYVTKRIC